MLSGWRRIRDVYSSCSPLPGLSSICICEGSVFLLAIDDDVENFMFGSLMHSHAYLMTERYETNERVHLEC